MRALLILSVLIVIGCEQAVYIRGVPTRPQTRVRVVDPADAANDARRSAWGTPDPSGKVYGEPKYDAKLKRWVAVEIKQ